MGMFHSDRALDGSGNGQGLTEPAVLNEVDTAGAIIFAPE